MERHRTAAPALLSLVLLLGFGANAHAAPPSRIVFPVVGQSTFHDDFGAPRPQGRHEGNDIMAARRAPAVAAEGGRVTRYRGSRRAGCMLFLKGRSGTLYLYVHLNNDLTRRNDNRARGCRNGVAYAPGLRDGQLVRAGQLIGYVGDSGDANGVHPHLHFELHPGGRRAVSPYRWLRRGSRVLFAVPARRKTVILRLSGTLRATGARLAIRADRVQLSTGWRSSIRRTVRLAIPSNVVVERATAGGRKSATLAGAAPGERILVRTLPRAPTLAAQLARPGTFSAGRVLLLGKR